MKDEEIIALAKESELVEFTNLECTESEVTWIFGRDELVAFARDIADLQKEKDAQICDKKWEGWISAAAQKPKSESWPDGYTPYDCAKSIRLS